MSLDVCLPDLERKGVLDVGRSKEARALYAELHTYYSRSHGPDAAAALASQGTVERLEAAAAHKKRNAVLQLQAQAGVIKKMRGYAGADPMGTGPLNPKAAEALFDYDGKAGHNDTVEARRKAIKGRAHAMIDAILYSHHADILGRVRQRAELDEVVRELFKPGSTGNDNARELADAWSRSADMLRARYNEAGGQIGKLENWGLPQSHSSARVRKEGYQAWREFITPLLDRDRMIDYRTGLPFTDEALEGAMRETFERIRTDGWSQVTAGAAGGKMLANQKAEHRFLHFKDGDAWLAYADKFGSGNPFDAMMSHIEGMSRDIALMEILGPNPAATVRWLGDTVMKTAQLDASPGSSAIRAATKGVPKIERLYNEITGALRRPESERLALGFSTMRSLQTAAKLGSAVLSAAPTDPMFGVITRKFNGLPATGIIGGYAKMLNPASAADRRFAVRAGLIAEEWSHMISAAHRDLSEEMTSERARRLSSGVLRASGLAAYTQAGRWAFGMEFLGHLTDERGKAFDALDAPLQRAMQRHGIGADTWDAIRNAPIEEHKGAGWILPANVEDRLAGDRLLQMIQTETDYAVPVVDLRTRAAMNNIGKRGTWIGEITRSALLFKSFGISLMATHGRRMLEQSPVNMALYAAAFFGLSTLGGAAALQLKEIAKGRDPRPIEDHGAEFWGAAALQGGGWGIYGDFLGSTENRFGGGFAQTLAGPLAQTAQNVGALTIGNAMKAIKGKPTNVGRDAVAIAKSETPGGSLWWGRLAFERLVADQLQAAADPQYRQSWRTLERNAAKRGQEFYWEPGELAPDRPPALAE
jgi:hypothetical protein